MSVAGTGYAGMRIATLQTQHNDVIAVDVVKDHVDLVNNKTSPFQDDDIEDYLAHKLLGHKDTLSPNVGFRDADSVIVAAPTNY